MLRSTTFLLFASAFSSLAPGATQDVLIRTREATLSAVVALPEAKAGERIPAILVFDIYTKPEEQQALAEELAARGYAGVVANTRGKGQSPDEITPYEYDGVDAHGVIDWISKQPWSDRRVGMIGSSYSGFTAWAAAKHRHPALKAIATSAAAIPGQGVPMFNNIFINANYAWTFYVTNNKLVDETMYADSQRWFRMARAWFASGRPYREIDAVDGTPNPLLQRWLKHPAFDDYWQDMVPYGRDFARIEIPALSITGYYDDAQISALQYYQEHTKYRPLAEHYLVVGPYDHAGVNAREKPTRLREYTIDPVAQFDSHALKLDFMDYVLKGKPRPAFFKGRVNLQVMGTNEWRASVNLENLHGIPMRLYFSEQKDEGLFSLTNRQPPSTSKMTHQVDMADRNRFHNFHAYAGQIVQGPLQYVTEAVFISQPFESATTILGSFRGEFTFVINKRDVDLGVTVYEAMPDGRLFHLGFALHRASYAENREKRKLLSPGKEHKLRFETSLVGRRMEKGSRLIVLVDANKTPMWQVNHGTGKDVSDESVADAGEPLKLQILSGSYVEIPLDNAIQKPGAG